jgi:hypothetical protein
VYYKWVERSIDFHPRNGGVIASESRPTYIILGEALALDDDLFLGMIATDARKRRKMTKIERLLSQPGVGKEMVRKIIGTPAGSSASVPVKDGLQQRFLKATVLRQSGTKLVK